MGTLCAVRLFLNCGKTFCFTWAQKSIFFCFGAKNPCAACRTISSPSRMGMIAPTTDRGQKQVRPAVTLIFIKAWNGQSPFANNTTIAAHFFHSRGAQATVCPTRPDRKHNRCPPTPRKTPPKERASACLPKKPPYQTPPSLPTPKRKKPKASASGFFKYGGPYRA